MKEHEKKSNFKTLKRRMQQQDFHFTIQDIIKIAEQAGEGIMKIYSQDDLGVVTKGDESPLTKADLVSNDIIVSGLAALDSSIPIMSEETIEIDYEERKDWEYFRCVDPLDGTKEFINHNGEFTVNIALIHKNSPIWGITHVPAKEETYFARKGQGAYKKDTTGISQIQTSEINKGESKVIMVVSRSHTGGGEKKLEQMLIRDGYQVEYTSVGSALKLCLLADGTADIYPRFKPSMERDIASAQCILEEAGGKLQLLNKKELTYNKQNLRNKLFIAYNPSLHLPSFGQFDETGS